MPKALDVSGNKYGRLLVISRAQVPNARNVMWHCKCDCGNMTIVAAANLGKSTLSCGCLAKETARDLLKDARYTLTHGRSHTPEHDTWCKMQDRCGNPNNPKFHRYGGRGIKVCQRWLEDFRNFLADMGPKPSPKHSIERKNNDGDYEPDNCRWATNYEQSRNKSQNNFVEIDGTTLCVLDWCKALNLPKWAPYELTRPRGAKRDLPPKFSSVDDAVRHLYKKHKR